MQPQDVAPRPAPSSASSADPVVDVEQAEAALVEHYPRLARLAYLVLPPGLGRGRRVLSAHALTQRALPRNRTTTPVIPAQSTGREVDPGYALVRLRVVRTALEAGLPLRRRAWPRRSQLPPLLPHVRGLKLFPRSGGADELALDQRLSALSGPGRAAYVLRGLERLPDDGVRQVLRAAGVADPDAALREADGVPGQYGLLGSPEFDPARCRRGRPICCAGGSTRRPRWSPERRWWCAGRSSACPGTAGARTVPRRRRTRRTRRPRPRSIRAG